MGKKIGIVVDSTADFPPGFCEKMRFNIVPVHVIVDGEDYLDGVTITNKEVLQHMKEGRDVFTRAATPAEYADIFEELLGKYDYLISFQLASTLSECYMSSKSAMNLMRDDEIERIKIIDTKNISLGQAMYAMLAVHIIKRDRTLNGLEEKIDEMMAGSVSNFTVDSLEWIRKSGRIGALSAMIGNMLDIKPIIALKEKELALVKRVRGKRKVLDAMAEYAGATKKKYGGNYKVWVAHCDAAPDAGYLMGRLAEELEMEPADIFLAEAGASIAVSTGPGTCGWSMVKSFP